MKLPGITLTGVDEQTPLEELLGLLDRHRHVEVGLLYSETTEGRNRYPGKAWLQSATKLFGARCAVHVCGTEARDPALAGPRWMLRAGRVQFNGWYSPAELNEALRRYPSVIVQHDEERRPDYSRFYIPGLSLLVDASGGRGESPRCWRRPETTKAVGFAGGLKPENLADALPRIAAVAQDPWWIDLESGLRTPEDWFSIERAEQVVELVREFAAGAAQREVRHGAG